MRTCYRPQTPIGDIMEHKYQKCWMQQCVYENLDRREELMASVSTAHHFARSSLVSSFLYTVSKKKQFCTVFTALHGMQRRSYDEISVRLSVCLSVCPSVCLLNACIVTKRKKDMFRFLYHTKEHLS